MGWGRVPCRRPYRTKTRRLGLQHQAPFFKFAHAMQPSCGGDIQHGMCLVKNEENLRYSSNYQRAAKEEEKVEKVPHLAKQPWTGVDRPVPTLRTSRPRGEPVQAPPSPGHRARRGRLGIHRSARERTLTCPGKRTMTRSPGLNSKMILLLLLGGGTSRIGPQPSLSLTSSLHLLCLPWGE